MKEIVIQKANLHNLKNIDITIPKGKFVVVTGVSGSGKSTAIFDILHEQGRKGYLQSIGYLQTIGSNEGFESIKGLAPTIAVRQKNIREKNPRSLVGTKTKLYSNLIILYHTQGDKYCPNCNIPIKEEACDKCSYEGQKRDARYFNFNSSIGMCPECLGRGYIVDVKLDKLIEGDETTLIQIFLKAVQLIKPPKYTINHVKYFLKAFDLEEDAKFNKLPRRIRENFLYGVHNNKIKFQGLYEFIRVWMKDSKDNGGIAERCICSSCNGYRIGKEGRSIKLQGKHIGEAASLTITELKNFIKDYRDNNKLDIDMENNIKVIIRECENLQDMALGHLTLYREMPTLSGGEAQRLFLITQINSKMDSMIYIFDEPTAGLHELEKEKLLEKIKFLKDSGNSVIVIEHDKNTINKAEYIIEFGPLAGEEGGQIIYEGEREGLLKCEKSLTGLHLKEEEEITLRDNGHINRKESEKLHSVDDSEENLSIFNASLNNLKNIDVHIPLGKMVGIAGLSGSGKTSLIFRTLIPLLKSRFKDNNDDELEEENDIEALAIEDINATIQGGDDLIGYAEITQSPIGRTKKSIPLTYLGLYDKIQKLFAKELEAKAKGLKGSDFSFNSKGRCDFCMGMGTLELMIGDLGEITNVCPECNGKRFRSDVLEVTYKGKTIYDVLNMSVSEAAIFFRDNKNIYNMFNILERIGMGYMKLGQSSSTLSGGEAQRIKLAKEIGRLRKGKILYVLDEPTTGLSFYDTANLLIVLDELVKMGNSVIVIEHDPKVLSHCNWIIELGPEGGTNGGYIIAEGTPQDLSKDNNSKIGQYLICTAPL